MFDLYLFTTVINLIWYIFTIIFVLYKYTAFFGYIYNFVKFGGKLASGVWSTYNYLNTRRNNYDIESGITNNNTKKSVFTRCKNYIIKNYNYYYKKAFPVNEVNIPLFETNYSSQIKFSTQLENEKHDELQMEMDLFNEQMDNLRDSESETDDDNQYLIKNEYQNENNSCNSENNFFFNSENNLFNV